MAKTQPEEKKEPKQDFDKDTGLETTVISAELQTKLLAQIETEYQVCWRHLQSKRIEWLRRLKLYNNQKRDQSKVGDPLLFTVFQTVFAALYDDKLVVKFEGREEGDDEAAENVTALAEFDSSLMEMDEINYDWIWDAMFFGRGFILLNDFDRSSEMMTAIPEVIDPTLFLRDPKATSINGNAQGFGGMRFGGRELGLAKWEMEDHPGYFNVKKIKKAKDLRNMKDEVLQARHEAQGRQTSKFDDESLTENYEFNLLQWFTHFEGKKIMITYANNRKLVVRYRELKTKDKPAKKWPIIDRPIYPISHDWDGVTVPDLIEDKQRARSVMINLGMESAKADLYPMYLYDKKKITNPRDLDFQFNKFIPIKGDTLNALAPVQKSIFHQQVNLILEILDTAAQKAVAAPDVAQGVQPSKDRTLGETQLVSAGKSVRHNLSARVFGWSEKRFWQQWYTLIKENFVDSDKKVVRIQGPLAPEWRELTKENLTTTNIDPDVIIESRQIAEANRQKEFNGFSTLLQIAIQAPETNRRYALRKAGKILGQKTQELNFLFPPSIHELRATDENSLLSDNKLAKVNAVDDDQIHIEIHNKATDTKAKVAHIEAHKEMMMFKAENPELFPVPQALTDFKPVGGSGGGKPAGPSAEPRVPASVAAGGGGEANQPVEQ